MVEKLSRIDGDEQLRARILPHCRLNHGEVWLDPVGMHRIGVANAESASSLKKLLQKDQPSLIIADPPYNIVVGSKNTDALFQKNTKLYNIFATKWINTVLKTANQNASFYVWLGADYKNGFHPIPEFCIEMRAMSDWKPRNWITLRNQRGYGTQKNWMWIRQELFYFSKGDTVFNVNAEYTDIPKILKGYYKNIDGKKTSNIERSRSETIRAGNVWVDIQQVFYRLEENVPGCYAQKPLKSIERIIDASSNIGSLIFDPFAHSGTTVIAAERLGRRCLTCDIDPIYAEISIRRLERFRATGKIGWQCESPFPEIV